MNDIRPRLQAEVAKVVVGQDTGVDILLVAIAVGGHVLIEGVPGVAKTLMARAFARATGLDFTRIQFTPDMLPSDVVGTMVIRDGDLAFRAGPVFTQVLLADEINRTPPKTQSALLEAMGEGQVTVDGTTRVLPTPFLVAATQNPIEYEGTYPLPEAQLDRFLVKLDMGYPAEDDELAMLKLHREGIVPSTLDDVEVVASADDLVGLRAVVDQTTVSDEVAAYVAALVRATRTLPAVEVGASPRAAVHLLAVARATARLNGRDFVIPDDVMVMAPSVLAHRLVLRPEAEIERYQPADAIAAALSTVPVPR
ncbi:MAG: MoxR family ATPase [Acidimicrobiia bacterium]|nr:MAG: MoxR family ATPase [Acidimicrobiia bacterium]